jgi:hypothetical protein
MPAKWPTDIEFKEVVLSIEEKTCTTCGSDLIIRKDRIHCIHSLEGPLKLVCKLSCCSNKQCPERRTLISPKTEIPLVMPRWRLGWDIVLWMGFRRFKRHWSIPQIQAELFDSYHIQLSKQTMSTYLKKYQLMVAARHQDVSLLREAYQGSPDVILSIDGVQPEKGHETLYVVRELRQQRVWFAEPLLSSSKSEIRKIIQRAKRMVQELEKPVRGWISDKQEAFVTSIAAEFPQSPHRYCNNHFLRDLAQEMLEQDSHAKVQMRKRIRGLRQLEKETLADLDQACSPQFPLNEEQRAYAAQIVLDYCAAVRGILNDNHGGPLTPPGWRMTQALEAICDSLEQNLQQPPTPIRSKLNRLYCCIQRGLALYHQDSPRITAYVHAIKQVWETLHPENGPLAERQERFHQLREQFEKTHDPIKTAMSTVMKNFAPGLFVGSDDEELPGDNLELERWIKRPKGHERNIHGRHHVGLRLVYEGPTLLPALDAHLSRTAPFTYHDLLPYVNAEVPESQRKAVERHRIMTKASSKKNEQRC